MINKKTENEKAETEKALQQFLSKATPQVLSEDEFHKVYRENADKELVYENELEHGFSYDIESNNWFNFELKNVIIKSTPKAILVKIEEIFGESEVWIPKSLCLIAEDGTLLEIDEWIISNRK